MTFVGNKKCPKCRASVPWTRTWIKCWGTARWNCHGCGALLRFNPHKRMKASIAAVICTGVVFAMANVVSMTGLKLSKIVISLVSFAIYSGIVLFDDVELSSTSNDDRKTKDPLPKSKKFSTLFVILFVILLVILAIGIILEKFGIYI